MIFWLNNLSVKWLNFQILISIKWFSIFFGETAFW
jgi:hypothetical protein